MRPNFGMIARDEADINVHARARYRWLTSARSWIRFLRYVFQFCLNRNRFLFFFFFSDPSRWNLENRRAPGYRALLNLDRQVPKGSRNACSRLGNDRPIFGNYRDYLIHLAANDFSLQSINLGGRSCKNASPRNRSVFLSKSSMSCV